MEVEVRLPCNHAVGSASSPPLSSSILIHANADTYSSSQLGSRKAIYAYYVVANSSYRAIHYNRYNLIDDDWRETVGGTNLAEAAEALPSLTWPPPQQEFIDSEDEDEELIELVNNNRASAVGGLKLVKELCIEFYTNGDNNRDTDPNNRVWRTAHKAADQMETRELNWGTVNPWTNQRHTHVWLLTCNSEPRPLKKSVSCLVYLPP